MVVMFLGDVSVLEMCQVCTWSIYLMHTRASVLNLWAKDTGVPPLFQRLRHPTGPFLCKTRFSSYSSTKTTRQSRLSTEADIRIQLAVTKQDAKEICRNVKLCYFSHQGFFFFNLATFCYFEIILMFFALFFKDVNDT